MGIPFCICEYCYLDQENWSFNFKSRKLTESTAPNGEILIVSSPLYIQQVDLIFILKDENKNEIDKGRIRKRIKLEESDNPLTIAEISNKKSSWQTQINNIIANTKEEYAGYVP